MRFPSVIRLDGKTATGIPVPDEVVEALGGGKRIPVTVTIGDYHYRSSVASRGGAFVVPISAEHRSGAGVQAGDEVEVDLTLDDAPREVVVPDDLAAALAADAAARSRFDGLSYSNQSRIVLSVEGAKAAETRQRRIDKAVTDLRDGKI
jgi:hypothetical protein